MITKIYDNDCVYEVGQNNVSFITEWHVNKDSVDIYRIADKNNNLIDFKGFTHKDYVVERDDKPIVDRQLTIFDNWERVDEIH